MDKETIKELLSDDPELQKIAVDGLSRIEDRKGDVVVTRALRFDSSVTDGYGFRFEGIASPHFFEAEERELILPAPAVLVARKVPADLNLWPPFLDGLTAEGIPLLVVTPEMPDPILEYFVYRVETTETRLAVVETTNLKPIAHAAGTLVQPVANISQFGWQGLGQAGLLVSDRYRTLLTDPPSPDAATLPVAIISVGGEAPDLIDARRRRLVSVFAAWRQEDEEEESGTDSKE